MKKVSTRGLALMTLRKTLGLTQENFGKKYGDYEGYQIGYYERTGEIPADLLEKLQRAGHDIRELLGIPLIDKHTETIDLLTKILNEGDQELHDHLVRQLKILNDLLDYQRGRKKN
jgi:hypothetical protein